METDLTPAEVLAALYNHASPQGICFIHYDTTPMTVEEAQEIIDARGDTYFDYLKGRVMKVDVSARPLYLGLYDRDNGAGAGERAILDARR